MNELLDSAIFWVLVVIFAAVAIYAVNAFFGRLADARSQEQSRYPHRVANELPRELHTKDRDEVLDLKDQTETPEK